MNCYAKLLFFKRGGYEIRNGKIFVNIDKVVSCAKEMLKEIIRIQIDIDFEKGEKYVKEYFIWTNKMNLIAEKLKSFY